MASQQNRKPNSELTLLIRGEALDFDAINRQLDLAATDTQRAGELLLRLPSLRSDLDEWTYGVELTQSEEVDATMSTLLTHLAEKKTQLDALQEAGKEIVLRMYVRSDYASIFYRLMPESLHKLSQLGLPLEVSVLSWGRVTL